MSRYSLSLYVTRGKRYYGIALAVILLGLGATMAPGQEDPPGDMAQQAALAGEEAYKLVQANKLDEARQAYAKIVTDYQQTNYAVWDSAITAMGHVRAGEDQAAGAVIEQMNQDYSTNPFIAKAINKIGDIYRDKKRYDKALELYQKVLDTWPQADYAVWSQKSMVYVNFAVGDSEKADTALNNLLTNFANQPQLENAVNMLAGECLGQKRYAQSRDLYQYNLDHWPQGEFAIWARQGLAITNIKMGYYSEAQTAVDTLISNFPNHPQIAQAVNKVGDLYRGAKRYELAQELYQQVVNTWPQADYALWAQKSLASIQMRLGDLEGAQASLDTLFTDFTEHEKFQNAINMLATESLSLKKYETARQLYQYIVDNLPQDDQTVWAQQGIAICQIKLGYNTAAQATVAKIISDYRNHKDIAKILNKIADHYRWTNNITFARDLYQYVVQTWPETEYALWAQKSLTISNFQLGEETEGQTAVDDLLANFLYHPKLKDAVKMLATECQSLGKYETSRQLNQYLEANWPQDGQGIGIQQGLAINSIKLGDETAAQTAIDKLLADFAEHGGLPLALYRIAYAYNENQQYDKARDLYNYILSTYPAADTLDTQMERALAYIILNQDEQALTAVDTLLTEFASHSGLSRAVFIIGEEYYSIAMKKVKEGEAVAAQENFAQALDIWQNIVDKLPHEHFAPHAHYFVAVCHRRLHQYFQAVEYFQKVVDRWPNFTYAGSAQSLVGAYTRILRDRGDIPADQADPFIQAAFEGVVENYKNGFYPHVYKYALGELGRFHMEKSQWPEATMYFETFRLEFPEFKYTGWILDNLVQSYEAMGEPALAIDVCEEFIRTCPDDRRIGRIMAMLDELTAVN